MISKVKGLSMETLEQENALLRVEVETARRASDITANLVVEQFVKLEDILRKLEEKAAIEAHLRERLSEDLHELEIRERDLSQARIAADAANRAKSIFLANMSHELRTPMNAIIGYSEMLTEEAEESGIDDFIPDLKKINAAGKHLLALINDILDFSKIEAGKMELYLESFDINTMIQDVISTIQPLVEKNTNTLQLNCSDDLGDMRADLTKVRQALFNLISNACKFTKEGTISITVLRSPSADIGSPDWVTISVADTGIGMTAEQKGKLFQAFSQGDASTTRQFGGTGLGLAISRHVCQMMGGDITVESEAGKGSIFTITIPAEVALKTESEKEPEPPVEKLSAESLAHILNTVLVIDDDPRARELVTRILTQDEFRAEARPSLILLDLMMPEMDGFQFIEELRKKPGRRSIPIAVITAKDLGEQDRRRLNGYVQRIIQKGAYSREALLREVRHLVNVYAGNSKDLADD